MLQVVAALLHRHRLVTVVHPLPIQVVAALLHRHPKAARHLDSDRWTPLHHAIEQGGPGMLKVAVLVGPPLATTGSYGWVGRREAAPGEEGSLKPSDPISIQEKRPGTSDPTVRPWPLFQWLPKSPFAIHAAFDHPGLSSSGCPSRHSRRV